MTDLVISTSDNIAELKATIEQQDLTIANLRKEVKRLTSDLEENKELIDDWIDGGGGIF